MCHLYRHRCLMFHLCRHHCLLCHLCRHHCFKFHLCRHHYLIYSICVVVTVRYVCHDCLWPRSQHFFVTSDDVFIIYGRHYRLFPNVLFTARRHDPPLGPIRQNNCHRYFTVRSNMLKFTNYFMLQMLHNYYLI